MCNITKKTDREIRDDVLAELNYDPSVKITDIGVLVSDGILTLNGVATSYDRKLNAVNTAKRVAGVRAIADEIKVKLPDSLTRTDGDIASAVTEEIKWRTSIPIGVVQVMVREGWITLEGQVEWQYQKEAAEDTVRYLPGVNGVSNAITIKCKATSKATETAKEIEISIKAAFDRSALLDAERIGVETVGSKVILRGRARNHAEREEAERVAWAAKDVCSVDNELIVEHP